MTRHSNHHEYSVMLSAYLDGELSQAQRTELLQHLASCAECRATLDEYRSIGTQLRSLPPVHSPDELTDAIYAQTVDAPPRRLFPLTSRFGYPVAAVAAVLLVFVVAVFLLVDGYQRGIDPTIVGSSPPGQGMFSIHEPIQITFNKEMDRESVEAALIIQPTSERDQLDMRWDGNTLIIGGNRPLKPGSSYEVSVTTDARDKWGNRLSEEFSLSFATSSSIQASDDEPSPTPTVSPTATPEPQIAAQPTRTPTQDLPASPTPEPVERATNPPPTSTPAPPATGEGTPPNTSGGEGTTADPPANTPPPADPPPADDPVPTATPTPLPPTPTPTPEPVPTEEPTPIPPTEVPEPTATAEPEPEPTEVPATPTTEPEPSPTPDVIAVAGSFGNVYWGNEPVQTGLGGPVTVEHSIEALELDFQRGKMFLNLETGQIYVMETGGYWSSVPNSSSEPLPEFIEMEEEGIWEPGGTLGFLWHQHSWIEAALGYAVEGSTQEFVSTFQEFENGMMLSSADGFILVLYTPDPSGENTLGLTWELYPDAGPLSDPGSSTEP